jgi:predicted amidophosphoribosyltransferase
VIQAATSSQSPPLKVAIFDVSDTVLRKDGSAVPGIATAISRLRRAGVRVAVAANERSASVADALTQAGVAVDLVVGRDTAKAKKPSPRYCYLAGEEFDAEPHEMLYVGDNDVTDALCAVNAGVLYLAARWANAHPQYGLPVDTPDALLRFVFRFMMDPPRWYWVVDRADSVGRHVHVRALLPTTRTSSDLKAVLKEGRDIQVEGLNFWGFLSRRLLTALALDGVLTDVDTWAWYPGHDGTPIKPRYSEAFNLASRIFRDRHVADLLVRHQSAVKLATSRAGGVRPPFSSQVHTVHLKPAHRAAVVDKHVLIADDFCTEGLSFEWARNLLYEAGARDVTCVSIGRYWDEYKMHVPKAGVHFDPWVPCSLGDDAFRVTTIRGNKDDAAEAEMRRLLALKPPGTTPRPAGPAGLRSTR